MRIELDHIVLAVTDMEAMLKFYIDVLGLQPHRVEQYRAGTVPFPCARITENTLIDLLPPAMWNFGDENTRTDYTNLNHFCLALEKSEWEPQLARLEAAGIEVEMGPMMLSGARGEGNSIYIRDPDGNRVELRYYD